MLLFHNNIMFVQICMLILLVILLVMVPVLHILGVILLNILVTRINLHRQN
jgi:hypothetical protein